MSIKERILKYKNYIIMVSIAVIAYILLYGVKMLNPLNVDWLMANSALKGQYYEWLGFRNSSWMFPIGMNNGLAYPDKSTISYSNVIPLFAIIAKLFKFILPTKFQYFGIWGLLCIMAQSACLVRLMSEFFELSKKILIGASFSLMLSLLMGRMYVGTALGAQWLITIALLLLIKSFKNEIKYPEFYYKAGILMGLASLIHIYYAIIVGAFLIAIIVNEVLNGRKQATKALYVSAFIAADIYLLLGMTSGENMLYGWIYDIPYVSLYLDSDNIRLSYIGIGEIGVLAYLLGRFLKEKDNLRLIISRWKNVVSVLLLLAEMALVLIFPYMYQYRMSSERTLLTYLEVLLQLFIAPIFVCGIAQLILVVLILRNDSKKLIAELVVVTFALQFDNIGGVLEANSTIKAYAYESAIEGDIWDEIAESSSIKHLNVTFLGTDAQSIAEWGIQHGLTVNSCVLQNSDNGEFNSNVQQLIDTADTSSVYIFRTNNTSFAFDDYPQFSYFIDDNYILAYNGELHAEEITALDAMTYTYTLNDVCVINGVTTTGMRTILSGGTSYGPYCYLRAGEYRVEIDGGRLENELSLNVYSGGGVNGYDVDKFEISDDSMTFEIHLDEDASDMEIVVNNRSDQSIYITEMRIIPIEIEE